MGKLTRRIAKFLRAIGPGFITGASDDDPSGIGTYAQTGALFGYGQLWTALFSFPFMTVVQEMCGRIGMVTGRGLAGIMRRQYRRSFLWIIVCILLITNAINIGANLGAMAAAVRLSIDIPFPVILVGITAITLLLEVFVSYRRYARYLKYLALSLFAYIATAFIVRQDWSAVLFATIRPNVTLSSVYLMNVVAILGTTISPYLFFWQASEEVEEEVLGRRLRQMGQGKPKMNRGLIRRMRLDTISGMLFSNLIMFFIILTAASTLHSNGVTSITTAAQAAEALRPLAGNFAALLFAVGILGAGFLSIPVLAGSASYALAETLGIKEGLYRSFRQAHGFYGLIALATLIGLGINFTSITPFRMLYYTAVLNGVVAPPLLFLILKIGNDKKIMGRYVNGPVSNLFGTAIAIIMSLAALALLASMAWELYNVVYLN